MHTQLEAARMLTWQAAELRDSGSVLVCNPRRRNCLLLSVRVFVTDAALQLHGGYGYIRDLPLNVMCVTHGFYGF